MHVKYILSGLLLNAALALFLTAAFSQDIQRRLSQLMANVKRMDEVSGTPVDGNDEIDELDRTIRRAKQEIVEAAQQKNLMLMRIADNIVSPLTVASVALEDAIEEADDKHPAVKDKMAEAALSLKRVGTLVDDLLNANYWISAEAQLHKTRCDLSEIIAQSINGVKALAQEKDVTIESVAGNYSASADTDKLLQALTNLLNNAIKFSPRGSTIHVRCSQSTDRVVVSVQDSGPGIDSELQNRLFDKFARDDSHGSEGFGLGLSIVKQIADAHGGFVTVSSTPGKGSTFSISLPTS